MYVRRAALDAVGRFDERYGLGYGEENDFCRRLAAAGFRNVLLDDTFVAHVGNRSFDAKKAALVEANSQLLISRFPDYPKLVQDFIAADAPHHLSGSRSGLPHRWPMPASRTASPCTTFIWRAPQSR
ncbi:MAG: hypothetical protein IPM02_24630 [Betaproteobacteria bacterium]|nr:hypothetical protein [Betaproteobacteria bacterium]